MVRPAQYSAQQILDAAAELVATVAPRARRWAPSLTDWKRVRDRSTTASRPGMLFAELWLQTVEAFQTGFEASLAGPDAHAAGLEAALDTPRSVREHPVPAALLLLHHREDFLPDGWPPEVADRAAALGSNIGRTLKSFSRRALGSTRSDAVRRACFAVVDVPGAVVRTHLRAGGPVPSIADELVRDAYLATIAGSASLDQRRR